MELAIDMPIFASIIASFALVLSAWVGTHQHAPSANLGANSTISALSAKTNFSGSDLLVVVDNSVSPATTKNITLANATSSFKVFNDLTYSPLAGSASLVTTGTITSGTWNGTKVDIAYGGTASTTLATGQLFTGNGTGALQSVSNGVSGQILTSNGASAPTFQSVAVALNTANVWTATNTFQASSITNNALILNSLAYKFPSSRSASSTVLSENGAGTLSFVPRPYVLYQNTNLSTSTPSLATTTLATITVPANTLGVTSNSLRVTALWSSIGAGGGGKDCYAEIDYGNGTASTSIGISTGANGNWPSIMQINTTIYATSTTGQTEFSNGSWSSLATGGQGTQALGAQTSFNLATQTYLGLAARVAAVSNSCLLIGATVELLPL